MNRKLSTRFSAFMLVILLLSGCSGTSSTPSTVAPTTPPIVVGFTPASVCLVPNVVGLDMGRAEDILIKIGLQPIKKYQEDPNVAKDALISQEPTADTRLEPCTGDVTIVVSLGGPIQPTETPAPPTLTPTGTPIPPTATPTPDPRMFWDDFEEGIKPEWGMTGENFISANGKLVAVGHMEGYLGDSAWTNYQITFNNVAYGSGNEITLFVRWQDRDNHMKMKCFNHIGGWWACDWYRVVDGLEQLIAGTPHDVGWGKRNWQIDVDKNGVYRMLADGEVKYRFVDSTFTTGGIMLMLESSGGATFELESFEIIALP